MKTNGVRWIFQLSKPSSDPDTMYHHQAMREPDRNKLEMPSGVTLPSSVWQMKRKRKPSTGEISKYKARLKANGTEEVQGVHYKEIYAPVVGWATIIFFMTLAIINNWHTR